LASNILNASNEPFNNKKDFISETPNQRSVTRRIRDPDTESNSQSKDNLTFSNLKKSKIGKFRKPENKIEADTSLTSHDENNDTVVLDDDLRDSLNPKKYLTEQRRNGLAQYSAFSKKLSDTTMINNFINKKISDISKTRTAIYSVRESVHISSAKLTPKALSNLSSPINLKRKHLNPKIETRRTDNPNQSKNVYKKQFSPNSK
jgi:hypothetical protein